MYFAIAFTFILILFCTYYHTKKSQNVKTFPGPKPFLFLGNILDFSTSTSKMLSKLVEYIETYGGIITVHLGFGLGFGSTVLFVTDYKLSEYVLTSTKMLKKSYIYDTLTGWLSTGLLMSTGAKWKSRRKMITPSFHFSVLRSFIKVFESVGENFIKTLNKEVGKPSVDIYPLISLYTLDIICEAAMGISINALDCGESEYVRSVKTMCRIVTERAFDPVPKFLYPLTPNYRAEKRALKILHSHTDEVIDKRIRDREANPELREEDPDAKRNVAFLDLLLESTIDGKPLSRSDLREEVDTFMFEGHDTTSSAIAFIMYSLAINPEVQNKVVDEQELIFGKNKDAPASVSDINDMKYLELVIKEALRMYPPVPIVGREFHEDVEWDGVVIPKGQAISLFIFGIHRNPKYFPNPEKFIPERFEEFDGKQPFCYVPFSAGPRNCIGQKFAMMELKSTISKIIRHFQLCPSEPAHKLELAPETILLSKNGVRISLKKREW